MRHGYWSSCAHTPGTGSGLWGVGGGSGVGPLGGTLGRALLWPHLGTCPSTTAGTAGTKGKRPEDTCHGW